MKKTLLFLAIMSFLMPAPYILAQDLQDIMSQLGAGASEAKYEAAYKFDTYMQMEFFPSWSLQITRQKKFDDQCCCK